MFESTLSDLEPTLQKLEPAAKEIQLREFTLESFLRQANKIAAATLGEAELPRAYRLGVDIG